MLNKKIKIYFLGLFLLFNFILVPSAWAATEDGDTKNDVICPSETPTEILIYYHGLLLGSAGGYLYNSEASSFNTFKIEYDKIAAAKPGVIGVHVDTTGICSAWNNCNYSSMSKILSDVEEKCTNLSGNASSLLISVAGHSNGGRPVLSLGAYQNANYKIILLDAIYSPPPNLTDNVCSRISIIDGSSTKKYTPNLILNCEQKEGFTYVKNETSAISHYDTIKYLSTFYLDKNTPSASTTPIKKEPLKPEEIELLNPLLNLQVKIPGLEELAQKHSATCTLSGSNDINCSLPWISIYIKSIFNYSIAVVGFLAVITLMIGGIIWLVSGGNMSRLKEAKSWIGASLTGVLIATTSYILLNEINPDLVGFKNVELKYIPDDITAYETAGNDLSVQFGECNDTGFTGIISSPNITCIASNCRLKPEANAELTALIKDAEAQGIKLTITSALRSIETQARLWNQCMSQAGATEGSCKGSVAPPNCDSPHIQGIAVDVCIAGSASCGHAGIGKTKEITEANKRYRDCDTYKLEQFFKEQHNWVRFCNEWWHFEYSETPYSARRARKGQDCSVLYPGIVAQPKNCK